MPEERAEQAVFSEIRAGFSLLSEKDTDTMEMVRDFAKKSRAGRGKSLIRGGYDAAERKPAAEAGKEKEKRDDGHAPHRDGGAGGGAAPCDPHRPQPEAAGRPQGASRGCLL